MSKNQDKPGLERGERAPDFVLPLLDGTRTRFYAIAGGNPAILLFCKVEELNPVLLFAEELKELFSDTASVIAVKSADNGNTPDPFPLPIFSDVEAKVRSAYRVPEENDTVVFVLDPNLRVLDSMVLQDPEETAQKVKAVLAADVPEINASKIVIQAPVLLIPNILDFEKCEFLINVWKNHGSEETGVEHSQDGRRQDTISADLKNRRDHIVMDEHLIKLLSSTIGRRVMPEVLKAFAFRATRFEGFKIVCYDAETGGFFHAHRDNLSPSTAHRRFALTLNLNDDYDGGYLRFPEYGSHLYRPEAGNALVFSCSHLHEVTEVTKNQRFAVLSFLFGDGDVRASQQK